MKPVRFDDLRAVRVNRQSHGVVIRQRIWIDHQNRVVQAWWSVQEEKNREREVTKCASA